jgi:HEPN domain-containing protein
MPDSTLPAEWFAQGDLDVQAAEILLSQNGPLAIVAFHLQQTIEKYLKGYLLSTGWPLRRIHDLETLLREAIVQDADFARFLAACQKITEYYIEARYPIGVITPLRRADLQADLNTARALIALIQRKVVL